MNLTIKILLGFLLLTAPLAADDNTDLMQIYSQLAGKKRVDLTHAFGPNTPVWEGFGQAVFSRAADPVTGAPYTVEKDGFRSMVTTLVGQYGTHVDPPAHFDLNGVTMDRIPLEEMILPLVVFDITPKLKKEPAYCLTVQDILEWEKVHGRVPKGSFAALRTDMSLDWESDPGRFKRHPFPAWTLQALKFLYEERGIVANGHEGMDTDNTPEMESEVWLLRSGHWQIEVMAHLDQVPERGALLVVSWPKVKNGLGFPARAYAILP